MDMKVIHLFLLSFVCVGGRWSDSIQPSRLSHVVPQIYGSARWPTEWMDCTELGVIN